MKKRLIASWLTPNVIGFSLASFFSDISYEMTTAALPRLMTELVGSSLAPQFLGFLTGFSDVIASFFKLLIGWLSDSINRRKPFIFLGYAIATVFLSLIGAARSAWAVIGYRTLAWTGKGFREPPRDALIATSTLPQFYGRAFGFQRAMDSLGAILGPLLMLVLIKLVSLRVIFFMALIPGTAAVLSIVFLTHDKKIIQHKRLAPRLFVYLKELPRVFVLFIGVLFIFSIGFFNKILFLQRAQELLEPTYGSIRTTSLIVILYTLFNCVRAMSEYGSGFLSDHYSRKKLLAMLGFGLFGLMNIGFMTNASTISVLVLLFAIGGLSVATVTSLGKAYAADLLPAHVRGTGYGLMQAVEGISSLISNILVGFLWSYVSPTIAFTYVAIVSLVAAFLLLLIPDKIVSNNL